MNGTRLRRLLARVLLIVINLGSFGALAFVSPLVGALAEQRPAWRRALFVAVPVTAALVFVGVGLLTSVPDEREDLVARDDVGFTMLVAGAAMGVASALLYRSARPPRYDEVTDLPGVDQALARRERREKFQQLAVSDPTLARELGVGRPDRPGAVDDGGLLDLAALDAAALEQHGGLSRAHARSVVEVREQLGHLSSVDELVVHGTLDLATAEQLRRRAVFLGRLP